MHTLGIDIETFSEESLKYSGIYKYVHHESFDILLITYCVDGGELVTLQYGETMNEEFINMLTDPDYVKTAWNVPFEFTCLQEWYGIDLDISQWQDTMIKAAMAGYPMSLDIASKAMGVAEKMTAQGKALIKYFTVPCKPTAANGFRTRNMPWHDPQKWQALIAYNQQDVVVEQAIYDFLIWFNISPRERKFWLLDQKINMRGIKLDLQMVERALIFNEQKLDMLMSEAMQLTGLNNPNSVKQLKEWFEKETDSEIESLTKENIKSLKELHVDNEVALRMLEVRQEMAKSSTKKYKPMKLCASDTDHRARGLLQFFGAGKTGRWSSRIIQLHNIPKNSMDDIHLARDIVKNGDLETLELIFGNVPNVMSQLLRTAFIAEEGYEFGVSDFSAIEARVLSWFAGEEWRLEVFRGSGKIYEESGSRIFKIPVEEVVKEVRFKAKTAELALGYQGGVGAIDRMEQMGLKTGLKDEEKLPLVRSWRAANPRIVNFWNDCEECAIEAVENPGKIIKLGDKLKFLVKHSTLFIQLPSGRFICYVGPTLKKNKFGKTSIHFWTVDQKTKRWVRDSTYGGKLVENIVQGTSRDLLADAMLRLDQAGFDICLHVHDEVVFEVPAQEKDQLLKKAGEIMGQNIPWASGLPLKAESYTTPYYLKM